MAPPMEEGSAPWRGRIRGAHEMVAALLSACKQPMNKNQIIQKANFSSSAVKYYLGIALKAGLVELNEDGTIATTSKGRTLLTQYDLMTKLLEDDSTTRDK